MVESRGYIFPVFTNREMPKRGGPIKADLIYEASLWLEGGRGAGGEERGIWSKMEDV